MHSSSGWAVTIKTLSFGLNGDARGLFHVLQDINPLRITAGIRFLKLPRESRRKITINHNLTINGYFNSARDGNTAAVLIN